MCTFIPNFIVNASINNEITLPIVPFKHSNFPYAFNNDTVIHPRPSKAHIPGVNQHFSKLANTYTKEKDTTIVYITKLVLIAQLPTPHTLKSASFII